MLFCGRLLASALLAVRPYKVADAPEIRASGQRRSRTTQPAFTPSFALGGNRENLSASAKWAFADSVRAELLYFRAFPRLSGRSFRREGFGK